MREREREKECSYLRIPLLGVADSGWLFLGCIGLELLDLDEWNDCWDCFLLLELLDCKEENLR